MGRCSLRIVRTDVVVNSVLSPLIYWDEGIAEGPLNNTLDISRECNGGDDGNEKAMCNGATGLRTQRAMGGVLRPA